MINIVDMDFGYRRKPLFTGLHMTLGQGKIYGLLGKNGAGKTTLLKLISGLLFPSAGDTSVMQLTPEKREPDFLSQVFLLPEEFELPRMNMFRFSKAYGVFYPNFSHPQLDRLMAELEVSPEQPFHQMSFGQRKKAYIAFAIACNTPLLIMDEPTNGLDIPSKTKFRRVIASIAEADRTIIISTHQVRDLDQLIDAVVILDESEILINASTADITSKLKFVQLEKGEQSLYSEQNIHGLWGVQPNTTGEDTPLDMELLFNAAIGNRKIMKEIFNASAQ